MEENEKMIRTPSGIPQNRLSADSENVNDVSIMNKQRKITTSGPFSPQHSGRAFGTTRPINVIAIDTLNQGKEKGIPVMLNSPSSASTNSRGISRNPPSPFSGTVITGISLTASGSKPESPPVSLEALQLSSRGFPLSTTSLDPAIS